MGEERVEHWIRCAKASYVDGRTTIEQFEEDVGALLEGRAMPGHFFPGGLPPVPSAALPLNERERLRLLMSLRYSAPTRARRL